MTRTALILLALLLCATTVRAEVWGSTKSKVYHNKLCRWMAQIKQEYRISFASPAVARKAGYQPCGTCRPPGLESVEPGKNSRRI